MVNGLFIVFNEEMVNKHAVGKGRFSNCSIFVSTILKNS